MEKDWLREWYVCHLELLEKKQDTNLKNGIEKLILISTTAGDVTVNGFG